MHLHSQFRSAPLQRRAQVERCGHYKPHAVDPRNEGFCLPSKPLATGRNYCMDFVWYMSAHFRQSVLDSGAHVASQWTKFLKFYFVALVFMFGWALPILVLACCWRCCRLCATVTPATCQRAELLLSFFMAPFLPLRCAAFRMLIFAFWRRCWWLR